MKSLFRLPNLLLLAVAIFAFSSCTTDPDFSIPPTVNLLDEVGFLANDATLSAGSPIIVKLKAEKGDNAMKSLEFQQDGARMTDLTRISIDGTGASSAAELLFDADVDAFTKEITITPHATGLADYTFVIADEGGESSSVTISITIESDPPTLSATNGILDIEATPGVLTTLALDATTSPSGAELATLSIYEGDDLATGTDRFRFNDIAFEGSIDLEGDDRTGLSNNKLLIRGNDVDGTVESFRIDLTDVNGLTASLDITVTAKNNVIVTPLEKEISGILFNAGGGANTGGLDLDTGVSTNSDVLDSEIKDEGIDLALPNDQNWKQKISAIDGAILKFADPANFPEAIDFDAVDSKEAIQGIFNASTSITVSNTVVAGDIFVVSDNGKNYLIEVVSVDPTTMNNDDSYTLNIKF